MNVFINVFFSLSLVFAFSFVSRVPYLQSNDFHTVPISNMALYQHSTTFFHPDYQQGPLFRAFTADRTRFRQDFLSSLPQPIVRLNSLSFSSLTFSAPSSLRIYTKNVGGGLLSLRKFDTLSPLRTQALAQSPSIIALLDVHIPNQSAAPSLPNYTSFYSPPWAAPHARPSSNSSPRLIGDRLIYVKTTLTSSLLFSTPTPHISILDFPKHHLHLIFVYYPTAAQRYKTTIIQAHQFLLQHLRLQHHLGSRFVIIGDFNATPTWAPRPSGLNWADRSLRNILLQLPLDIIHPTSSHSPPYTYQNGTNTSLIDLTIHSRAPMWLSTPPTTRIITRWAQSDHYAQFTTIPFALTTNLPSPIYYPPYFLKVNKANLPAAADLFELITPTLFSEIYQIMEDLTIPMQRRINFIAKLVEFTIFLAGWDSGSLTPTPLRRNHTGHSVTNPFVLQITTTINSIKAELLTHPTPRRTTELKATLATSYFCSNIKAAFSTLDTLNRNTESAYLQRDLRTFWERLKTTSPRAPRFPQPNGTLNPSPHAQASIVKTHFFSLFNRPSPPFTHLIKLVLTLSWKLLPHPLLINPLLFQKFFSFFLRKRKLQKVSMGCPPLFGSIVCVVLQKL